MVVSELSPEQIIAIGTGVAALIGGIVAAARNSAQKGKGGEPPGKGGHAYLLLDADQVRNLSDHLGLLTVKLTDMTRALDSNATSSRELIRDLAEEVEQTRHEISRLKDEMIRGQYRGR